MIVFPKNGPEYPVFNVFYDDLKTSPRTLPRKLEGRKWSFTFNPYKGPLHVMLPVPEIKDLFTITKGISTFGINKNQLQVQFNRGDFEINLLTIFGLLPKSYFCHSN